MVCLFIVRRCFRPSFILPSALKIRIVALILNYFIGRRPWFYNINHHITSNQQKKEQDNKLSQAVQYGP